MGHETLKKIEKKQDFQMNVFHREETLREIEKKYPRAGIDPSLVLGDQINGYIVKGQPLEEYAKTMNELYKDDENSEQYRR